MHQKIINRWAGGKTIPLCKAQVTEHHGIGEIATGF
jgi:hypothetical protein